MVTLRKLLLLSLPLAIPILLAQGCYSGDQVIQLDCPENGGPAWDKYCKDAGAGDAGDAGDNDGSTTNLCPGTCVPEAPKGWSDPMPHWIGPAEKAPADCPVELEATATRNYAELEALPAYCGACKCGDLHGECTNALTIEVRSTTCSQAEVSSIDISEPAGWDGECIADHAIPAGQTCPRG